MPVSLSLIIAVYNKPDALRCVLAACCRQTFRDFEVLVADDGSDADIADVIAESRDRQGLPVRHLWQEDRSWRKNAALNGAVRAAASEYLVFIDGDCIPHAHFLEDHWNARREGRLLCGRRVEMSERWSRRVTLDRVQSGAFERIGLREWWEGLSGRALRVEDGLRFRRDAWARMLHRGSGRILGSNFSLWKKDLERINGFDGSYDGPGLGEDSDIQYRLSLVGVQCLPLRHRAIQFHLWHQRTPVSQTSFDRFALVRRERRAWCEQGLHPSGGSNAAGTSIDASGDAEPEA